MEDQSPVAVHSYGVEPRQSAFQFLKVIARWHPQIGIGGCIVQHLKFPEQSIGKIGRNLFWAYILLEEFLQPPISP
jgi:hypothetical protein